MIDLLLNINSKVEFKGSAKDVSSYGCNVSCKKNGAIWATFENSVIHNQFCQRSKFHISHMLYKKVNAFEKHNLALDKFKIKFLIVFLIGLYGYLSTVFFQSSLHAKLSPLTVLRFEIR